MFQLKILNNHINFLNKSPNQKNSKENNNNLSNENIESLKIVNNQNNISKISTRENLKTYNNFQFKKNYFLHINLYKENQKILVELDYVSSILFNYKFINSNSTPYFDINKHDTKYLKLDNYHKYTTYSKNTIYFNKCELNKINEDKFIFLTKIVEKISYKKYNFDNLFKITYQNLNYYICNHILIEENFINNIFLFDFFMQISNNKKIIDNIESKKYNGDYNGIWYGLLNLKNKQIPFVILIFHDKVNNKILFLNSSINILILKDNLKEIEIVNDEIEIQYNKINVKINLKTKNTKLISSNNNNLNIKMKHINIIPFFINSINDNKYYQNKLINKFNFNIYHTNFEIKINNILFNNKNITNNTSVINVYI